MPGVTLNSPVPGPEEGGALPAMGLCYSCVTGAEC